jgi:hypothetical protein
MSGLSKEVWEVANRVGETINAEIWIADDGPSISWGSARMAIGGAILAERKRCADVARSHEAVHVARSIEETQ